MLNNFFADSFHKETL